MLLDGEYSASEECVAVDNDGHTHPAIISYPKAIIKSGKIISISPDDNGVLWEFGVKEGAES